MIVKIILGLIGLGVVVFVHELGHFIAARLSGIDVEAFSIGWGKPIFSKNFHGVEYRIGIFPVGGYCRMKGEAEFKEALTNNSISIPREPGTFYGASPLKRIFTAFAGPFANAIFAVLVLTLVWAIGFDVQTLDNKIVLASEIEGTSFPADAAGLKSGDRIIGINGKKVSNYTEIQEQIAPNPGETLNLLVDRNGEQISLQVKPQLDTNTGAGRIGIYFWTDPIIETVKTGSPAHIAGLMQGDRIVSIQGIPIPYSVALYRILKDRPTVLPIEIERNGQTLSKELILSYDEQGQTNIGIEFKTIRYRNAAHSIPDAFVKGASETLKTLTVSLKSLTVLFKGVNLSKAVSGPVRITYMVGDIAAEGFGQGFGAGFTAIASFLALISISLSIMNLLPIPALDGGLILLFFIELITRKPLHPKAVYWFQMLGALFILSLLIFSVFGDILFLFGKK
ncbi:site-2 protease family protein [Gracilinema caldarium]|uniref:site-2 protease family protein n=1 Tax=Gracilinema caldarium TaxID=215591 RepID=UPI0026EFC9A4|nr:site-2 protease family protein [Gracilinema caldarium]